jgi:hypothetical protein
MSYNVYKYCISYNVGQIMFTIKKKYIYIYINAYNKMYAVLCKM